MFSVKKTILELFDKIQIFPKFETNPEQMAANFFANSNRS